MVKISNLPSDTTVASDDLIPFVDVSAGTTEYVTKENFLGSADSEGWKLGVLPAPDTITYNGNRNYTLVFNSTDLTDTLSEGMRLRLQRTVSAPTQCTDLESGSSQYWRDTTVSGMTFTDDFVAGAWVKLESYSSGGSARVILSRYNDTSGWRFDISDEGQVRLIGYNAGSTNYSLVSSYQSIPLGRWVHVAAQLDMSAFTATSTTSYVMIDGVDVPCFVSRSGTNPTALVQAGNLEVGSKNSGGLPFDGKIAQAFVSSAKITQANVRTLISQGLTASLISTHSIVSAYSFDNSANDLNTTNANNLTAMNSAGYSTDSPFGNYLGGTLEYGIVAAKPTFSTNTTVVVQVPEGCAIPTSGGISAVSYSTNDVPYGFPKDEGQWELITYIGSNQSSASMSLDVWTTLNVRLRAPIGKWEINPQFNFQMSSGSTTLELHAGVNHSGISGSNQSDPDLGGIALSQAATTAIYGHFNRSKYFSLSAERDFIATAKYVQGTGTVTWLLLGAVPSSGGRTASVIKARFALL